MLRFTQKESKGGREVQHSVYLKPAVPSFDNARGLKKKETLEGGGVGTCLPAQFENLPSF